MSANSQGVSLKGLHKQYGGYVAVDNLSLDIQSGEFFSLLGPSGCGKTTTLRMIAGFLSADRGEILIGGATATHLPPNRRDVGFVFQNYALWPHMTVAENIAFGLKLKKLGRVEVAERVQDVLAIADLSGLDSRFPRELSGGQQQRVAVARALALRRSVLLMDEPLSNLDRKLRVELRKELRDIQRKLGLTVVYVTHDQEEALSLSDRVAVMQRGRIAAMGAPEQIYRSPGSEFVAGFVGNANLLTGDSVLAEDGSLLFDVDGGVRFKVDSAGSPKAAKGVKCIIRPEWIELSRESLFVENEMEVQVAHMEYLGNTREISLVSKDGLRLLAQASDTPLTQSLRLGDHIFCHVTRQNVVVLNEN